MVGLPLATERLRIDNLTSDDAEAISAYRSDPSVAAWQSWTPPYSLAQTHGFLEHLAESRFGEPGHKINLALRSSAGLVGDVYFHVMAESPHAVEVGVTVAPWAQKQGYATEAISAGLAALFAEGEVVKAIAYVDSRNSPSLALFDRLGFTREGYLSHSFAMPDGSYADEVLFGLVAGNWELSP